MVLTGSLAKYWEWMAAIPGVDVFDQKSFGRQPAYLGLKWLARAGSLHPDCFTKQSGRRVA
jgi:hypothetical protein